MNDYWNVNENNWFTQILNLTPKIRVCFVVNYLKVVIIQIMIELMSERRPENLQGSERDREMSCVWGFP